MWWFMLITVILILLILYLIKLNEDYYILSLCKRIKTVDGSRLENKVTVIPGVTRFGNNIDLITLTPAKIFRYSRQNYAYAKGNSYILYFLKAPIYSIATAADAEEIFQSTTLITKSVEYSLVKPFLGDGLLISTDQKWHFRRKMLTPAFHFNVLQSFSEIFKEESLKLLGKLQNLENMVIDVIEIISEFSLNNICETALGVKLYNISGSSEYRKVIHDIEKAILQRLSKVILFYDILFYLFGPYKRQKECIKIAHDFSSKIIKAKRKEYQEKLNESQKPNNDDFGLKKRYAMLDTLLAEEAKGFIDHQGICDEVNTFMFEGYDTTATCLIFALMNLSLYPEVQQRCRKEIQEIADFSSMTVFDFNKLEYVECVIKETLRLYPSVPFVGRLCTEETRLNGLILPQNTQIHIHIYDIMRDPRYFLEPNAFKPERFLHEATMQRNPFAFVPFSAGSRNCIGQKFAMLEMKAVLVAILKEFEIFPITKLEDLIFRNGIILRTEQKIYVKLKKIQK